jgi:hypothetical protein
MIEPADVSGYFIEGRNFRNIPRDAGKIFTLKKRSLNVARRLARRAEASGALVRVPSELPLRKRLARAVLMPGPVAE